MKVVNAYALTIAGVALAATVPTTVAQVPPLRVVILGTGTPNPDPERSGPSVAVVAGGQALLVDAGPGLVRRAAAARQRHAMDALAIAQLRTAFITHLHSDHTVGLPDLIHTGWVEERAEPLRLFGPPGIDGMAHHLTEAWREDIRIRTAGVQPSTPDGWRIVATTVREGIVYRDSTVTVRAFAVPHTNWEHAFGYRFEAGGQSVVISGDTRASEAVVDACGGCDVLVHEVYSTEALSRRPAEWQRYHRGSHTSTVELADLAGRAKPKLLVLYHQLYWGVSDDDLIGEIRAAGYRGAVVSASDLAVFP